MFGLNHIRLSAIFFGLLLTGCSAGLPDDLRSPGSEAELAQGIEGHCRNAEEPSSCRSRLERAYCRHKGGRWTQFYNGCRDRCAPPNVPQTCTQDTPMGCECGRARCWNGLECVPNPGPRPEVSLALTKMDRACFTCEVQPDGTCDEAGLDAMERCQEAWFDGALQKLAATGYPPDIQRPNKVCLENKRTEMNGGLTFLRQKRRAIQDGEPNAETAERLSQLSAVMLERLSKLADAALDCGLDQVIRK